jgi:hypothetical protein
VTDRRLVAVLHGPRPEPTTTTIAVRAGGFDGGCRTSVPLRPSNPTHAHDELVVQLVAASRVYRGAF